jgi:ATP-binding cassette, subfamily C (CFTR/MRP), member 1
MAIFASMIAITVVTPTFLLAMMPIFAVYIAVTNYYRNVARELKRLDSISRSPIYAHFSETLGGLPVIRSYLRQKMYRRVNEVKLDDNIAAYYAMKAVDRWLSVRLEVLGECVRHACFTVVVSIAVFEV